MRARRKPRVKLLAYAMQNALLCIALAATLAVYGSRGTVWLPVLPSGAPVVNQGVILHVMPGLRSARHGKLTVSRETERKESAHGDQLHERHPLP
jgi:hypothetical protein